MILKANLLAGFGSIKYLPLPIVLSTNNANPKLILYDDYIEYRGGFITNKVKYETIEKIDVYFLGESTNNIVVYIKNSIFTFLGNFEKRLQLKEFLKFFKSKGCKLTDKAELEVSY